MPASDSKEVTMVNGASMDKAVENRALLDSLSEPTEVLHKETNRDQRDGPHRTRHAALPTPRSSGLDPGRCNQRRCPPGADGAPSPDADFTFILGINHDQFNPNL